MKSDNHNITSSATRFTVVFSVVAALILPVGYFTISYQSLMAIMETEAEINSKLVSSLISANPDLWRYETIRIEELLARRPRAGTAETRRIIDVDNNLVAESVNPIKSPQLKTSHEVLDGEEVVGKIEIIRSMLPILLKSGIVALFGMAFGLLLYRWLPFKAVIKAGKKLQDANDFLKRVMDGSTNSLVVLDLAGNIQMFNKSFETLSGYSVDNLAGQQLCRVFTGGDISNIEAALLNVSTAVESNITLEVRVSRHDGLNLILYCGVVPLFSEGIISGVIVSFDDITKRKEAEEELQKRNAEIEQFIYNVSHDLRSPLVTVKTFMEYLENDMVEGDQARVSEDLQFIHNAANKMKLMLDELLEMSRIGSVITPPVQVLLMDVVNEALDALAGVINERKVDIHLPETDLMLFGERPRLCQIWQNLIENAIKYSRDDSTPCIELGVKILNDETIFFVKDNGKGVDPQYHSKIFGIFEKLNPDSPGAGIGLSMVQRIVDKCGGRIWVESAGSDQGSCFLFTLPKAVVQN